jgi:hypothetical protein
MCPPPRSLALEANGCFMVQVQADLTEYKVAVRSVAPDCELPSDQDLQLRPVAKRSNGPARGRPMSVGFDVEPAPPC